MTKHLEVKTSTLECKYGDSGAGTLSGYASVKHSIDSYGDTIEDGAYVHLDSLTRDGYVTFGHANSAMPVGYITSAKEDDHGLYVEMEFHGNPEAQEVRRVVKERMAAGKTVGLSIDFYPVKWEFRQDEGAQLRVLQEIEVVGFAIVNLPAERLARATAAKSGSGRPMQEQFESLLAELEDWKGRVDWIAANRRQGLSDANVDRLVQVRDALNLLIDGAGDSPEGAEDTVGFAIECEAFLSTIANGGNQ